MKTRAWAGWMAALMLAAAPVAFCDELPPGVEVKQAPGAQQEVRVEEEPEEESSGESAVQPQTEQSAATPAAPVTGEETVPRQSPQTGDSSLLALAGLGVSALVLAAARKGALGPGKNSSQP